MVTPAVTGSISREATTQPGNFFREATRGMLNYAYGVLMGRTQVQLIAEGYDPTIGILHGRESERGMYPAFALDRMNPMRPVVDRAVLRLINDTSLTGGDFSMQSDGVCRLNPQLARHVAQLAFEHCATSGQSVLSGD
jgi:CRISPR-associated protein Cas1